MTKWRVVLVCLVWLLTGCAPIKNTPIPTNTPAPTQVPYFDKPGQYLEMIESGGQTRWFAIYLPSSYLHGTPTPLVLNYHGAGSTFQQQALISGMDEKAETEGFVVVYPQALPANANVWALADSTAGSMDIEFTQAILDDLHQKLSIDPKRIYATGFSNGGGLVDNLGCFISDTFAAIAPVAGTYVYWAPCETSSPVSVIAIHGDADSSVVYSGGGFSTPGWAGTWAERNGCDPSSSTSQIYDDISVETWDSCPEGREVTLYTIAGGGHVWPGSAIYKEMIGVTKNLNATDFIWDFFEGHPSP